MTMFGVQRLANFTKALFKRGDKQNKKKKARGKRGCKGGGRFNSPKTVTLKCGSGNKTILVQDGIQRDKPDNRDMIKPSPIPLAVSSHLIGGGALFNVEITESTLKPFAPNCHDYNQKDANACGGFAGSAAVYILLNRMQQLSAVRSSNGTNVSPVDVPYLSPLWTYWYARLNDGMNSTTKDEGTTLRSVMKALKDPGVIDESVWGFNSHTPTQEPDGKAVHAQSFKIHNYMRIPMDENAPTLVKDVIAIEQLPIVGGLLLYEEQMDRALTTGIISPVKERENAELIGGHAICITGFKPIDDVMHVEFINSWGEGWGDKGYGYFPISWTMDPYYVIDLWTFDKQYF